MADLARFTELPNTNSAGMRIRAGSLVRIEQGYGAWSKSDPEVSDNSDLEFLSGTVECWHSYDGEREFIVQVAGLGVCVPARFITLIEY
jgi:hypothetical protein